jgi:hypothetical protein
MAITPDTALTPSDANYTPGAVANLAWKENLCVVAGDRIELVNFILDPPASRGGNLQPDHTPGYGRGFSPHWRYTPKWAHKQSLNENGLWNENGIASSVPKLWRAANGNIGARPVIRVDLNDLYCPWDGEVSVEGGMGASNAPKGTQLVISYIWDQTGRVPRIAVDTRLKYKHRLTFWMPYEEDAVGLPITIPVRADAVWTSATSTLLLDNGPGTFAVLVTVSGESGKSPVSGFTRVTPQGAVPAVIFGITL